MCGTLQASGSGSGQLSQLKVKGCGDRVLALLTQSSVTSDSNTACTSGPTSGPVPLAPPSDGRLQPAEVVQACPLHAVEEPAGWPPANSGQACPPCTHFTDQCLCSAHAFRLKHAPRIRRPAPDHPRREAYQQSTMSSQAPATRWPCSCPMHSKQAMQACLQALQDALISPCCQGPVLRPDCSCALLVPSTMDGSHLFISSIGVWYMMNRKWGVQLGRCTWAHGVEWEMVPHCSSNPVALGEAPRLRL